MQLSELIYEFKKFAWYQINRSKSVAFLYSYSEKGIKKIILFTIASRKNKILRNKFNKVYKRHVHWKLQNIAERD